jgi:hypothetical protein
MATASTVAGGASPAGRTITVTVPQETTVTVPKPKPPPPLSAHALAAIQAAYADPAKVPAVTDAKTRELLTTELSALDAFLAPRPKLQPYRAHIWLVAHEAKPMIAPSHLAALLWCTVWFPSDCR